MIFLYLSLIDNEEDRAVFEQIYNTYRTQMYIVAQSILHNTAEAEDVVHDVFYNIAKKYMPTVLSIDSETGIRNYLLKSTKNTALNRLKHPNAATISLDNAAAEILQSSTLSDDEFFKVIYTKIEYQRVVDSILSLNEKYRHVLYYHLILGFSFEEIAKQSHENAATIRKQFSRGKALLLAELNITEGDFYDDQR